MTKVTLSIDEATLRDAKRLAAENQTSVSAMFARFIRSIAGHDRKSEIGPITTRVSGLAAADADVSYRDSLEGALLDKYGLDG